MRLSAHNCATTISRLHGASAVARGLLSRGRCVCTTAVDWIHSLPASHRGPPRCPVIPRPSQLAPRPDDWQIGAELVLQLLAHLLFGEVTSTHNRANELVAEHRRVLKNRRDADRTGRFCHDAGMTVE